MRKKLIYLTFALVCLFSCETDDDMSSNTNQLDRIVDFVEDEYLTYWDIEKSVYVANVDTEVVTGERVNLGDSVYINYAIYQFYSSIDKLIYTNIQELAEDNDFDPQLMSFEPLAIKYGSTDLLKGLNLALENMISGATYMVYMPSSYAYGGKITGVVPKNSSLAVMVNVVSVVKNK